MIHSILFAFHNALRNGNLDLYYLYALYLLFMCFWNKKYGRVYRIISWIIPFFIMTLVTFLFSEINPSFLKLLVFILKISLCIIVFVCVEDVHFNLNYRAIIDNTVIIFVLLTLIAFITRSNYLWRFADYVNGFSKTRLQLASIEPSGLSEIVGIMIIYYIVDMFKGKDIHILNLFRIFVLGIILVLSAGLSGIACMAIGLMCFFVFELKNVERQLPKYLVIGSALLVIIITILGTQNPIHSRILAVISGTDGSFNYRYTYALQALLKILPVTHYCGLGFGNMNTVEGLKILNQFGMEYAFSNSYMYLVCEGGMLAIVFLCFLLGYMIYRIIRGQQDKEIKASILVYVVTFQIIGGYFTNPFTWFVYGMICSSRPWFDKKKERIKITLL